MLEHYFIPNHYTARYIKRLRWSAPQKLRYSGLSNRTIGPLIAVYTDKDRVVAKLAGLELRLPGELKKWGML